MAASKFLENGTFREVARAADAGDAEVALGAVVVLGGVRWCVVGTAPNPNRPGERLVFVERADPPPSSDGTLTTVHDDR